MKKKYYELTFSQSAMRMLMLLSMKSRSMAIPFCFKIDAKLDMDVLYRAVLMEFDRNDIFRIRFDGLLMKKQYFREKADTKGKIRIVSFTDGEKEREFLEKESKRPFKYTKGETVRFVLINTHDGKTALYVNFLHLIIDAYGILSVVNDIFSVYEALLNGSEMPLLPASFEKKIIEEHEFRRSDALKKELVFADKYYSSVDKPMLCAAWGMDRLKKYRIRKKDPEAYTYPLFNIGRTKSERLCFRVPAELSEKIHKYCSENKVSPSAVVLSGLRTYCSAVNERNESVTFTNLMARRKTRDDKRMGGCLVTPILTVNSVMETCSFNEMNQSIMHDIMQTMRFSDTMLFEQKTLLSKVRKFNALDIAASFYFSYIPFEGETKNGEGVEITGYNPGDYSIPLYIILTHDTKKNSFECHYVFTLYDITSDNVRELHENALRVIEEGIENPEITVGELLDLVKSRHIAKN